MRNSRLNLLPGSLWRLGVLALQSRSTILSTAADDGKQSARDDPGIGTATFNVFANGAYTDYFGLTPAGSKAATFEMSCGSRTFCQNVIREGRSQGNSQHFDRELLDPLVYVTLQTFLRPARCRVGQSSGSLFLWSIRPIRPWPRRH